MAADLVMTPALVRRAAGKFGTAGRLLHDELGRLRHELAAVHRPWGDDSQGRAFAAGYLPKAHLIQQALAALATGLDSIDMALRAGAHNVESADAASALAPAATAPRR